MSATKFTILVLILNFQWITTALEEYDSPESSRVEKEWESCCRASDSMCSKDTCYRIIWSPSSWSSIRNRCRISFSSFTRPVDLADISTQEDASNLYQLLNSQRVYRRRSKNDVSKGLWTSGTKCSSEDSNGKVTAKFIWRSNNQSFPDWLMKDMTQEDDDSSSEGCQFLIIAANADSSKLTYDFKDSQEEYFGICEFKKSIPSKTTAESTVTYSTSPSTTASTATKSTTKRTTTSAASSKSPATTTITTKSIPTKDTKIRTFSTDRTTRTSLPRTTEQITSTTAEVVNFSGCKRKEASGITWPDTLPGKTVKRKCPIGMKGTAEWTCDAVSLTFQPPKPRIRNCRHEWLDNLQKEIESRKDAVELSKRIANKTTHTFMSHGDLSALVNLTEKLLTLFESQRKSILTHVHLQQQPPSYHFAKSMVTSYSHVLRSEAAAAWTDLDQRDQLEQASRILQQITKTGHHLGCAVSSDSILQHTLTEENINLQTFLLESKTKDDYHSYQFPHGIPGEANNTLTLTGYLNLQNWLESPCNGKKKTAVGILYKNLQQFLNKEDSDKELSPSLVVSPVISFSFNTNLTRRHQLPDGVTVQIELERYAEPNNSHLYQKPRCAFWNFNLGEFGDWDSSGCITKFSNSTHTICSCDHLTNFAVLMDVNNNISTDDVILHYLTIICCALSSLSLLATFISLLAIRALRCRRSTITCNLSLCLFIVNLIMLFGFDQTKFKVLCAVIAGVLHFSVLAAFCWMLLEGFHLYQMVVLIFSPSSHISMVYFYSFGYGIPAIIVAVSAAIEHEGYGRKDACWLSDKDGLMWSLAGPIAVIVLINFVIFVWTMKSASTAKIKKEHSSTENAKAWIKGSASILCLLGLTWAVGFLYMSGVLYFTSYIFTVLNGLQGVFIFVFHVLFNEKTTIAVMKAFRKRLKGRGLQRQRPETLTSTQQLRSTRSLSSGLTQSTKTDNGRVSPIQVAYAPTRSRTGNSRDLSIYAQCRPPNPVLNDNHVSCNGNSVSCSGNNVSYNGKFRKYSEHSNGTVFHNR